MNWYFEVLKKYAVFNGRASREEYWIFVLINWFISIVFVFFEIVEASISPVPFHAMAFARAFLTFIYIVSIVFEVVLAFLFGEQASGFQQELL